MNDLIVIAIVLVIIGLALRHIIKAKKSGNKCIGCSGGCCTTGKCCSCGDNENNNH